MGGGVGGWAIKGKDPKKLFTGGSTLNSSDLIILSIRGKLMSDTKNFANFNGPMV